MNDKIYYKGMIYLVPEYSFKRNVLQTFHDLPVAGHQGFLKTYRKIRERFSYKGLKRDIMHHIKECNNFQ
jgi:predicted metal-dependent hydrolase